MASWGVWAIAAAITLSALGLTAAWQPTPIGTGPDVAPSAFTSPVAWNVLVQRVGEARHLVVDAARNRVLFTAYVASTADTRFFVLDSTGVEHGNVSIGPWGQSYGARIALDPATGDAYVSGDVGGLVQVDPLGPSILARWTYTGFYPRAIAIHAGVLYVSQDYDLGAPWPIAEIDAATGGYLGNLTADPVGPAGDLTVDPAGRYLFVSNHTLLRVSLADGGISDFSYPATFAPSVDGHRIYLCADLGGYANLGWYSLDTDTAQFPVDGCAPSAMATSPVTGVVAFGSLDLGNETGWIGFVDTGDPYPPMRDVAWSGDGTALFGILDRGSSGAFEVGAWAGTPRFVPSPSGPPLILPQPMCVDFESVSGLDWSTLATTLDGAPVPHDPWTPSARAICVDATSVLDGDHILRTTGLDIVGQPMDDTWAFATDGTPPSVGLTSPAVTATLPYTMRGTVNETHPGTVSVNGVPVVVTGATWSLVVSQMHLGANAFPVVAVDALGNRGDSTLVVRYWPPYADFVRNATAHFAVPVPPGWTNHTGPLPGGTLEAITLVGPPEPPIPPFITVTSVAYANASASSAVALALAQDAQAFVVTTGGTVLDSAHVVVVANHSAATFVARVSISGVTERYIQTVIVAPEWSRVYLVTAAFPEATWSNHSEDMAWVLGGFQIDAPSAAPPGGESLPVLWWAAGAGAIAGAAALLAVVLWRRRRKGPPTAVPGPEASLPDVRPEGRMESEPTQDTATETDGLDRRP